MALAFKLALDDHIAQHNQIGATAAMPAMGMGAADPANAMRGLDLPSWGECHDRSSDVGFLFSVSGASRFCEVEGKGGRHHQE